MELRPVFSRGAWPDRPRPLLAFTSLSLDDKSFARFRKGKSEKTLAAPGVALKLVKRNSFIVGFFAALVLVAVVYAWNRGGMQGGAEAESPNGIYQMWVMAPLSPTKGGSYHITLIDQRSSSVIRQIVVSVPSSEQTVAIREGGGAITWDAEDSFADITIDGTKSIRVWVP